MHWPIQATVLILCIVTCAAQGRGIRRFSSTSVQEAIAEEDVVKNHRFQSRHGTRTDSRRDDITANSREFPSRSQSAEIAATRRTSPRIDNEIPKSVSRSQSSSSRERIGQQLSSTTTATTSRQYSSRSSRVLDNSRRRADVDINTEEAVTRGNLRSRLDRTRTTTNGRQDQESTTAQSRSRNFASREKSNNNQEKEINSGNTNQIRSRNGNGRQPEGSNRVGRGRSLSLEEPTTQSLRSRNRGYEKTLITDTGKSSSVRFNEGKSGTTRLSDSRNINTRGNEQKSNDILLSARGRGRVSGRGRGGGIPRVESPPTPPLEAISTKDYEEIPVSPSSEIPLELSSQEQLTSAEVTQKAINIPLMQLIADVSSDEPFYDHSTTRKLNENGNSLEPTLPFLEEKIKEATTAATSTTSTTTTTSEPTTRSSIRGRVRKLPNARRTTSSRNENYRSDTRTSELDTAENIETVTRSNRRNSPRFTSRPTTTTAGRGSVERPTSSAIHHGGRNSGRSREYSSRNELPRSSRTDNSESTTSAFRSRNNLYTTSSSTTTRFSQQSDDHTQNYDNSVSVIADKRIKVQIPSVVDIEVNKAFSGDSEFQINQDHSTGNGGRFSVTSDNPVPSGRKLGRGSARASKADVII